MELLKKEIFKIVPSICYEMFTMTIIESFVAGKPILASRLGGMTEIVEDGKTGLLVEPSNFENHASKIKFMLDNKDMCTQMGKNAQKVFVEKYIAYKNFEILQNKYFAVLGCK